MIIDLDSGAPQDHVHTGELAEAAAEAIRCLNHATFRTGSGALRYPSDVDAVIRSLSSMASRLPQLCEQVAAWLDAEQAAGRIGMTGDRHPDPALAADVARLWLERSAHHASSSGPPWTRRRR